LSLAWGVVLLGYSAWRTYRHSHGRHNHPTTDLEPGAQLPVSWSLLLAELALVVVAVVTTGSWDSPFVFCLVTPLIGIGFHGGFGAAIRAASAAVFVVAVPAVVAGPPLAAVTATGQWAVEFVLLAVLAPFLIYAGTARSIVSIWNSSETFAHGYIILPISLWLIWKRRDVLARMSPTPYWPALLSLAVCGFAWLLAEMGDVQVVRQYAFAAMLPLTVVVVCGLRNTSIRSRSHAGASPNTNSA